MAFLESLNNNLHKAVDVLTRPNPNRGAERVLAQPLPAVDYAPVNEPGSNQPRLSNAWYRLLDGNGRENGLMFLCRCGQANAYLYSKYDLRRELENDHHCSARCVAIVEKKRAENGQPAIIEQVRLTETDEKGNVFPVGAAHNLRDILPEHGTKMDERARNMVYATLPTWRLHNNQAQASGPIKLGDWGGPVTNTPDELWDGALPLGSDGRWI